MPVYAPTPRFAQRRFHPRTLALIVAGHAALLAAIMSARMDLPEKFVRQVTKVELIDPPAPPPPPPPEPQSRQEPRRSESLIDRPANVVPIPPLPSERLDSTPQPLPPPSPADLIGPKIIDPLPMPDPPRAIPKPVRTGPRFATPPSKVRPPYPVEKRMREDEAALRLRLSIDERGRVVAVEPVGKADRAFLDAARRHLIANWRYRPATEDGRPVASSTLITLRFQLED